MKRVVTFGEVMLRLTASGHRRLSQAAEFEAVYGGSEANAAVSLCNYGSPAALVTRLPENALGEAALRSLRACGVDVSGVVRGGNRLGLYFVERGISYRKQGILYDRAGSSMAMAAPEDFDWETAFADADWFHFSGVTPALGEGCAAAVQEACRIAKQKGLTVSCDLNYREPLWSRTEAERVMSGLMPYVDVCLAYEEEPQDIFGICPAEGASREEGHRQMARALRERFGFSLVAVTSSRARSAMSHDWSAMLFDGEEYYFSRRYEVDAVDRIGGGDAFSGALIHAVRRDWEPQQIVEFAAAAGCLKYTVEGDCNAVTEAEVAQLAGIAL